MVGYIRSTDDSKLDELMDILWFFDEWRASLEARPTLGDGAWKAHFITDHLWTDSRVCILGTVRMCRYLIEKDSRFKISPLNMFPTSSIFAIKARYYVQTAKADPRCGIVCFVLISL
ncbi:unnamed protein product [Ectocarpus sp. CCAP 1310/34]|nr:unnamed protein product [Ectocarpus sp. CCAP 1310/34]